MKCPDCHNGIRPALFAGPDYPCTTPGCVGGQIADPEPKRNDGTLETPKRVRDAWQNALAQERSYAPGHRTESEAETPAHRQAAREQRDLDYVRRMQAKYEHDCVCEPEAWAAYTKEWRTRIVSAWREVEAEQNECGAFWHQCEPNVRPHKGCGVQLAPGRCYEHDGKRWVRS